MKTLNKLWNEYISNNNTALSLQLLKRIRRYQKKYKATKNLRQIITLPKDDGIWRKIVIETVITNEYSTRITDNLTIEIEGNPISQLTFSNVLIFQCPVCLEEKIIEIILKCGHCLCKNCYSRLTNKRCPICRVELTVMHKNEFLVDLYKK